MKLVESVSLSQELCTWESNLQQRSNERTGKQDYQLSEEPSIFPMIVRGSPRPPKVPRGDIEMATIHRSPEGSFMGRNRREVVDEPT
jgi:hypothetical protein